MQQKLGYRKVISEGYIYTMCDQDVHSVVILNADPLPAPYPK